MLLNAISVVIGLFGTIALSKTMCLQQETAAYGNSLNAFIFVVFAVIILRQVYSRIRLEDKKGMLFAGIYSFALSMALTVGNELQTVEHWIIDEPVLWLQTIMLCVFFFGPVLFVFQWLAGKTKAESAGLASRSEAVCEKENKTSVENWKNFCLRWLVIFLCWLPVFLAFYPGAFVYDAQDEYVQVAMREFSTHHPLCHVLMLGGFVCFGNKFLGSYNTGIALYTIVQMIILSGVFSYTVSYVKKYLSKGICVGITLIYGLFPVFPMYAVCSAKDTLFNAAFLVMLIQMLKLLECARAGKKEKKTDVVFFILSSAVVMLLRNNGVIAYVAMVFLVMILAIIKWKKDKFFMRLAIMMLASALLYGVSNKTLAFVLHAEDSENQELLTVPIQQLARVYAFSPEAFSEEEKEILFYYIPEKALVKYDADLSDLVKAAFNNAGYVENSGSFWKLWWKTLLKKPVTYVNAWLMTSYGYWYPDTIINVYEGQQRFTFEYEDSSYFGFETEPPGVRDSKFPWLEEQYRRMSLEIYQQNIPGISMLFSPGFLFWIFFGSLLSCLYQKKNLWILPMISILLIWGTVIPGPTFLVRYVLILWFAFPLIMLAGGEVSVHDPLSTSALNEV